MYNKDIKVIVIGVGEMGKVAVRTLIERNFNLVAAIDLKPDMLGKDVAETAGLDSIGVTIGNSLKKAINDTNPDVAFFAVDPGFERLAGDLILCAENKINVLTINMDPFHRVPATAEIFDRIDAVFKENNVSLIASGINDIWWSGIGIDLCGTCKRIDSIDCTNKLPLENMSVQVGKDFHVNDDPESYLNEIKKMDLSQEDSIQGPLLSLLTNADILGLTVTNTDIKAKPCICQEDLYVEPWDMTVKKGLMQGQIFSIHAETKEGIILTTSMIIKVLDPGEIPGTSWDIKGEPDLHVELGDICGEITTAATPLNRIYQLLEAEPGIVTLDRLKERPSCGGLKTNA